MSNFSSLALIDGTLNGTAPCRFLGATNDSYATIIAAGYLNDISKKIKSNDVFEINYADASNFPLNTGESALYASFSVQYDPILGNWNLIPKAANQTGIAAYGVHSANYSYAGGSATFTISDASITPNSVVIGRFQSSANAETVETVLPGNGQITVVCTGNPGVSVFSYISVIPSIALQNQGVYAAQYSYAGGSATITISNSAITAGMVVEANFASQANASKIESVTAAAGSITIVCSANPGVSVIEYFAATASSALTTLGFYAAQYTNAGGSATTIITDSTITASSIVVADWSTQANGVTIEKVTPTASTLTILSSGDPGASVLNYSATPGPEGAEPGIYLVAANNLSDVASASASASNLGLGTGNNVAFLNVQAGNSGNAGYFRSYPATAANGYFEFQAVNNSNNFASILNNSAVGQATTYSLPDPGAATASIILSTKATQQTIAGGVGVTGNSSVTSGYFSLGVSAKTASTTHSQGGATLLTTQISNVTVANASDAILLPAVSTVGVGGYLVAINNGATAGTVYGNGGDTINGTAGSSGSVAFAASKTTIYYAVAAGTWLTGNVA